MSSARIGYKLDLLTGVATSQYSWTRDTANKFITAQKNPAQLGMLAQDQHPVVTEPKDDAVASTVITAANGDKIIIPHQSKDTDGKTNVTSTTLNALPDDISVSTTQVNSIRLEILTDCAEKLASAEVDQFKADILKLIKERKAALEKLQSSRWSWNNAARTKDQEQINTLQGYIDNNANIVNTQAACQAALSASIDRTYSFWQRGKSKQHALASASFSSLTTDVDSSSAGQSLLARLLPKHTAMCANNVPATIERVQTTTTSTSNTATEKELKDASDGLGTAIAALEKSVNHFSKNPNLIALSSFETTIREKLTDLKQAQPGVDISKYEEELAKLSTFNRTEKDSIILAQQEQLACSQKTKEKYANPLSSEHLKNELANLTVDFPTDTKKLNQEILKGLFDALKKHYSKIECAPDQNESINLWLGELDIRCTGTDSKTLIVPNEKLRKAIRTALETNSELEPEEFMQAFQLNIQNLINVSTPNWFGIGGDHKLANAIKTLPALQIRPEIYAQNTAPLISAAEDFKEKVVTHITSSAEYKKDDLESRATKLVKASQLASGFRTDIAEKTASLEQRAQAARRLLKKVEAQRNYPDVKIAHDEAKAKAEKISIDNRIAEKLAEKETFTNSSAGTPAQSPDRRRSTSQSSSPVKLGTYKITGEGENSATFLALLLPLNSSKIGLPDVLNSDGTLNKNIANESTTSHDPLVYEASGRGLCSLPVAKQAMIAGVVAFYHRKRQTKIAGDKGTPTDTNMQVALQYLLQLLYFDLENQHQAVDKRKDYLGRLSYTYNDKAKECTFNSISLLPSIAEHFKRLIKARPNLIYIFEIIAELRAQQLQQLQQQLSHSASARVGQATSAAPTYENDKKYIGNLIALLGQSTTAEAAIADSKFGVNYNTSRNDMLRDVLSLAATTYVGNNSKKSTEEILHEHTYQEKRLAKNQEIIGTGEGEELPAVERKYQATSSASASMFGGANQEDRSSGYSSGRDSAYNFQPDDQSLFSGTSYYLSEEERSLFDSAIGKPHRKKLFGEKSTLPLHENYREKIKVFYGLALQNDSLKPLLKLLITLQLYTALVNEGEEANIKPRLIAINDLLNAIQAGKPTLKTYLTNIAERTKLADFKKLVSYFSSQDLAVAEEGKDSIQELMQGIDAFRNENIKALTQIAGPDTKQHREVGSSSGPPPFSVEDNMRAIKAAAAAPRHWKLTEFGAPPGQTSNASTKPLSARALYEFAKGKCVTQAASSSIMSITTYQDLLTNNAKAEVVFDTSSTTCQIRTSFMENTLLQELDLGKSSANQVSPTSAQVLSALYINIAGEISFSQPDHAGVLLDNLVKIKQFLGKLIEVNLGNALSSSTGSNLKVTNVSSTFYNNMPSFLNNIMEKFYGATTNITFDSAGLKAFLKQLFFFLQRLDNHIDYLNNQHTTFQKTESGVDRKQSDISSIEVTTANGTKVSIELDNIISNNTLLLFAPEYLSDNPKVTIALSATEAKQQKAAAHYPSSAQAQQSPIVIQGEALAKLAMLLGGVKESELKTTDLTDKDIQDNMKICRDRLKNKEKDIQHLTDISVQVIADSIRQLEIFNNQVDYKSATDKCSQQFKANVDALKIKLDLSNEGMLDLPSSRGLGSQLVEACKSAVNIFEQNLTKPIPSPAIPIRQGPQSGAQSPPPFYTQPGSVKPNGIVGSPASLKGDQTNGYMSVSPNNKGADYYLSRNGNSTYGSPTVGAFDEAMKKQQGYSPIAQATIRKKKS